jgi:hypothetical protein
MTALYRREGDSMKVRIKFVNGTPTTGQASLSIPSSYTIDSSKLTTGTNILTGPGTMVGTYGSNTAQANGIILTATGTSTSLVYFSPGTSQAGFTIPVANISTVLSAGSVTLVEFLIPITGWS